MRSGQLLTAAGLLAAWTASIPHAQAQTDWLDECDRAAADPLDPKHQGPGVPLADLRANADHAIFVCEYAVGGFETERYSYQLGRALEASGAFAEARAAYAAAGDHAPALAGLGYLYDEGLGVGQDLAKALDLYRRADAAGYGPAAALLGYMYEEGRGVAQDAAEAERLYRKGAAAVDPVAERALLPGRRPLARR